MEHVKWYCEHDKLEIASGTNDGLISTKDENVEHQRHPNSLDSAQLYNRLLPVETIKLLETTGCAASPDPARPGTAISELESGKLPFTKQTAIKTDNDINTTAVSCQVEDGKDGEDLGAASVSSSKFYVTYNDDDSCSSTSVETIENLARTSEERKRYIKERCHNGFYRTHSNADNPEDRLHLFHCLLLVGLTLGPDEKKTPYTLIKYPTDAVVPPCTEYLCFPDAEHWTPSSYEQSYSLVLTSETGQRKFGYCRRVLPEGSPACLPLVYCILSPFRARGFYHKILKELESQHGQPHPILSDFISSLYHSSFPEPGQILQFRRNPSEEAFDTIHPALRRPYDLRLEEQDLVEIFDILGISVLLKVFGSLLLERKIVFISSSFSKLSCCTEAVQSILYPFSWQHVLIPVLPNSLLDICQSPTPYVVGILGDGTMHFLESRTFEGDIIVDLDESKVLRKVGDESSVLPIESLRHLRTSLELAVKTTDAEPSTRNVLISEAFLCTFVDICGHYRRHVLTLNGDTVFDCESFIKSASSSSVRHFLKWFVETQMFSVFIVSRLHSELKEDRFDQRALERVEEEQKLNRTLTRRNSGEGKKTKNLKERFKFWRGK